MNVKRAWFVAAAVALVGALGAWVVALASAQTPKTAELVVMAESMVPPTDGALAVRVVAAAGEERLPFSGTALLVDQAQGAAATAPVPLTNGAALVPFAAAEGPLRLVVEGTTTDARGQTRPARAEALIVRGKKDNPANGFTYTQWTAGLATLTTTAPAAGAAGVPAVPLGGLAHTRLPTRVALLKDGAVVVEDVAPDAAQPRLKDGRGLRPDRGGLGLEAPREAAPGANVEIVLTAAEPLSVSLDLILGGRVRQVANLDVPAGATRTTLRLPADAKHDESYVVHAATAPWPQSRGRAVVGRVKDPAVENAISLFAWTRLQLEALGGERDPFLAVDDPAAVEAMLSRLWPRPVRAPRVGDDPVAQRARAADVAKASHGAARNTWRGLAALAAVLLAAALWRRPRPGSDEAVLAGGGARHHLQRAAAVLGLALLLFALDAVLGLPWA